MSSRPRIYAGRIEARGDVHAKPIVAPPIGMGAKRAAAHMLAVTMPTHMQDALLAARATFDGKRSVEDIEPRISRLTLRALRRRGYIKDYLLTRAGLAVRDALREIHHIP